MKQSFLALLQKRKAKNIKRKKVVLPKWLFPSSMERIYDRSLYSLVRETKDKINEYLVPEIPSMIVEVESKMPNDRTDAFDFIQRLRAGIIFIRASLQDKIEETILHAELVGMGISKFNKEQFEKMNQSIFGIDLFVDEPWLTDQLKLFSQQNAQLITSLVDQELERVSGEIERGLQQGERFTDIAKSIKKSFGITHRRATLIARDQTTKLNSSLTRLRQQEVGVEEYEWQTSGDERVRATHRHNDGKIFRWDKPPPVTGHPGNDVNCRCVALPVLDKLLNFS